MASRLDTRFPLILLGMTVGFVYFISVPVVNYLVQVGLVLGIIYLVQVRDLPFTMAVVASLSVVLAVLLARTGSGHVPYLAGSFLVETGITGCLLGWGIKNRWPAARTLALAAIPSLVIFVMLLGNVFNLAAPFQAQLAQFDRVSAGSAGTLGGDTAAEIVTGTLTILKTVFPGINLISSLINLLVVYLVSQAAGIRLGIAVTRLLPAALWQLPFATVWVLAAGLALSIWGTGFTQTAGFNLLVVTGSLFAMQGWAIVRHFFVTRRVPQSLEYMTYLVMFLTMSVSPAVLGFFGLFDCWFNFRKLNLSDQPIKQGVK